MIWVSSIIGFDLCVWYCELAVTASTLSLFKVDNFSGFTQYSDVSVMKYLRNDLVYLSIKKYPFFNGLN